MNRIRAANFVAALTLAFTAAAIAAGETATTPDAAHVPIPPAASAPAALASGLDKAGMDAAVRPQDDLFGAMNGTWLKTAQIPGDKPEYGIFLRLRDLSDERVRAIVETLAATPQRAGTVDAKIADFYRAFIDTEAIDKAGTARIQPFLDQIAAVRSKRQLTDLMGRWQGVVDAPVALQVAVDAKDPAIYSPLTWQGGLGMGDRDYCLKANERFAKARKAYRAYVATLLALDNDKAAARHADAAIALEKRIAAIQWDNVANRDPAKVYNPTTLGALAAKAPGFDWRAFVDAGEMPVQKIISVSQPSYDIAFARLFASTPLETWKTYLRVRLLDDFGDLLPKAFRDARFRFRDVALHGVTEERPRWQQAVAALNNAMGEALGQIYVAQSFPPASKTRMLELVHNLLAAYKASIDGLAWMTPATKAAAQEKLSKYGIKIGYPDTWRDYSALEIEAGDPIGNAMRAARFEYHRRAVRVGHPVDRAEWSMTPQTVNAYYDPSMNEIVFPAAILQPPLFDMHADDAVNYGAIGAIIGHEISHGFDDQGSQYDGDGRLRDWWTEADRRAFRAITAKLVRQYDAYEPLPGTHLNGKLTLGENIADLSGLQVAYKAYVRSLNGRPAPVIDGLTGAQRFYLGWSQAWREKTRDERALQLVTIDPHAPARFRVNGAAVNADAFHEAFGTAPGDALWKAPADRIRLW